MKFNILDLDDAMLKGQADLEEIFKETEKNFFAPIAEAQIAASWQQIPDEMKHVLRKHNKKAVDQLEKKVGGL